MLAQIAAIGASTSMISVLLRSHERSDNSTWQTIDGRRPLKLEVMVLLTNPRIQILFAALLLRSIVQAQCPVDALMINGRVENAVADSKVRAQLVYSKNKAGESGEVSVQAGKFQIPIEFVTTQRSLFSNLPKRCGRKPTTVVVTLLENSQPSQEISLNFATAFKMTDASAYGLRSGLVLRGRPH